MRFEVFTRRYDVAPETLWSALKQGLTQLDSVRVTGSDDATMQAHFTTGLGLFSWGQRLTATVRASQRGGALLRVHGEPRSTFLASRWGEGQESKPIERDVLSVVENALG